LGGTFQNKANALNELGDSRGAVESCDQAIAIQERLVNLEGHRELAQELGGSYQNKAVAVSALGDNRRAVALCDQALAIWERLVNQEGRREFVRHLALTRGFRGENLITLGEREKGLQDIRSAQGLFDGEFVRTGAADLKGHARWCQQQLAKYA
jgi:tetratricopeptide (TPR) repeat protein